MAAIVGKGLDILSNIGALLREIEVEHVDDETGAAIDAREEVVEALEHYRLNRYRLGEALFGYRIFFKEKGVWLKVARIVGKAIDRDEKTILRIVEDYERASQLSSEVIKAMEVRGIDPSKRKNEAVVSKLQLMPAESVASDPVAAVETVLTAVVTEKAAKKSKAVKPIELIPASGTFVVVLPTPEDRRRLDVRTALVTALAAVPKDKVLDELQAVIEVAMYEVWGQLEPITIHFNPHPSTVAVPEDLELEEAA
ncbi:MAG: hypothetical protein ABSE46_21265 [Terracidiphilus sp.]|jgi:hypothetical protein